MKVFYTTTASDTSWCNDRNRRFATEEDAIKAAEQRIADGRGGYQQEVIILKAIKVVRKNPKEIVDITT